jgi:hypothetical protein
MIFLDNHISQLLKVVSSNTKQTQRPTNTSTKRRRGGEERRQKERGSRRKTSDHQEGESNGEEK